MICQQAAYVRYIITLLAEADYRIIPRILKYISTTSVNSYKYNFKNRCSKIFSPSTQLKSSERRTQSVYPCSEGGEVGLTAQLIQLVDDDPL